jgi:hypothetical protein
VWFAAVLLIVVAGTAFSLSATVSTGAMLLVLSLVPPSIVLLFWSWIQPLTGVEMIRVPAPVSRLQASSRR